MGKNPFFWLPQGWPRCLTVIVLGAAVGAFITGLYFQGLPLTSDVVPGGIVSFELAWKTRCAQEILRVWKKVISTALTQLHWDFGFLIAYSLFGSLICAVLAEAQDSRWPKLGHFLSWAMLVAGALDALEDVALIRMLKTQTATEFLTKTASLCAGLKFLIIFTAIGYLIAQGATRLVAGRNAC